ncbi:AAA family ATPase [Amycolatopsis sp. w19]|uniref:AAA family ATPase n=1 Tax=Amycolatopsis sp. w19 TaxID=3448134 RepID=UPI003F1B66D9
MLRSFRLGNHRSFRDEQELLLMPAMPGDERAAVPVAAIYGANASGKSNLLDGLFTMRFLVEGYWSLLDQSHFRLGSGDSRRPSTYVVELMLDDVRHTYGFRIDGETTADRVVEEWLYTYPEKRRRVIFERQGGSVRFGSTTADLKSKFAVLEELIQPNALLLSVCDRLQLGPLVPVYRWFKQELRVWLRNQQWEPLEVQRKVTDFIDVDPDNRARLIALLRAADTGITDMVVWQDKGSDHRSVRLHHGQGSEPFSLFDESAGTNNWLGLLPTVLTVLDNGWAFVVDEIDTSLHPKLVAELIGLFRDQGVNRRGAQLVFTTHDTTLLGTMLGESVLERDQIWFVDKNAQGVSELYPLTDFKPRKDQNTERRYLAGSYGAVPVLGDFAEAVLGR